MWNVKYDNFINQNQGCPKCGNSIKITQQEAEEKVLKKCKEKNYELVENFIYVNNETTIYLKCKKDNYIWKTIYSSFVSQDHGCSKCVNVLKITQEEAEKNVLNKCKKKNYELIEKFLYKNNQTKIHLRCNKDNHIWYVSYINFINRDNCCPKCNESKGENKISEILKENNINFIYQKKFENCRNKKSLPFDFYLPEQNILIEFDGIQHYKIIKHFGGEEKFKELQINDEIKNKFAKDKNIKLIRIAYFDYDNIEKILREHNII